MKKKRSVQALMLMASVLIMYLLVMCPLAQQEVRASELSSIESSDSKITVLAEDYPIVDDSLYGSRRLVIKGEYKGNTYGSVKVVNMYDYTVLQYSSKEETKQAYKSLVEADVEVSIDRIIKPSFIPNYTSEVDNGVSLIGLDTLQENAEYIADEDFTRLVAVLDTGISETSPLFSRVLEQVDFSGDPVVTDSHGEDVIRVIEDSTNSDSIQIISLKVFNEDNLCSETILLEALDFVINENEDEDKYTTDVINISLGLEYSTVEDMNNSINIESLKNKIDVAISKNIPVVVSAGNSGKEISTEFPACYEPCWTIGAVNSKKEIASFSNTGNIDFVAKGVAIATTDTETYVSGTSFSAPYISSLVATLKCRNAYGNCSVEELYSLVKDTCEDLGELGYDSTYGWGIPDANKLPGNSQSCEHSYEIETVIEPTCTEDGFTLKKCKYCGDTYEEPIESKGHTKGEIIRVDCKAKTLTYNCSDCGESIEEVSEEETHDFELVSTENATCSSPKKDIYNCKYCSEVKEIVGDTLEHEYITISSKNSTCTEEGTSHVKCLLCSTEEDIFSSEKLGHSYTYYVQEATCISEGLKEGTCERCGDSVSEVLSINQNNHVGEKEEIRVEPTCKSEGSITTKCKDCGKVISVTRIDKLKHDYKLVKSEKPTTSKEGYENYTCSLCGDSYTNTLSKLDAGPQIKEEEKQEVITVPTASIKKVKNLKGKKLYISAKSTKDYKYQYSISLSKNFKKSAKTCKSTKSTTTFKKLKKNKKYYVRCRYYKKVKGKTYYGKWSKVRTIKIKK